ncbi:RNB domain-containing ribonuclease [Salinibacterium sp. SWN1162]|uniref:RNB domain-containing ribonuclease n=1 Tax=Salinibacterium sp. SWN1162 TaxID=2792053 RepID=UPI0018CE5D26|nr:RNB domain-containing ribonuclease [Salinibacterium sp. SWN1162]MBH0008527.1 RNB domain-containing ribonuclease [Salinibacterium sp. SWN1162]
MRNFDSEGTPQSGTPRHAEPRLVVPRVRPLDTNDELAQALAAVRVELKLPTEFSAEVEEAADAAVAAFEPPELDLTSIPFVTIDPEGATDLDQALYLERTDETLRVMYAIAEVPAFVLPGSLVDAEARKRGQTLYGPDDRVPLHPTIISEDAASLLAGATRPAFVWTFDLDAAGSVIATTLVRAQVRNRRQYNYVEVQELLDNDRADESLSLLPEFGRLRTELERQRGGASLNRPDEEVAVFDGQYVIERRASLPIEDYNAHVSLMTGMEAARIMLEGKVGILRTMPAPDDETLEQFRRQVASLGCPWPENQNYGEYLRTLDHSDPRALAATHAATSLFRGAGYTPFDGELPEDTIQAAVAAPYAHATAPLRRLVDRFVLVACEAIVAGRDVPKWVREALPQLPKIMGRTSQLASQFDRSSVDVIEAALLRPRVGDEFEATVVSERGDGGVIQIADPVITARISGTVSAGDTVRVRLVSAEIATGTIEFELV